MSAFGGVSYGVAAAAFLALTLLLATGWQGRSQGVRLIAATAVTVAWATGLAWLAWDQDWPWIWAFTLEVLRAGAWIVVLTGLAQPLLSRRTIFVAQLLWIVLLLCGWLLALGWAGGSVAADPGRLLAPGGLAVALAVLVLLEQLYRNSNAAGRHAFKFLAIGLGGVFAYDLFMYSQAMLLKGISADLWDARGIVNALMVPCIAIAARRSPQWSLDVFVSRQAVVFTTAVVAVGIYLLVMALGGLYIREIGGHWGTAANVVFFFGALAVLALVVMSGTVRRRLKVFVSKHFFRNKYDYRVEWLRFVETLSGTAGTDDVRRTGIEAIARIFESPGGVLFAPAEPGRDFEPVAAWPMRVEALQGLLPVPAGHEMLRFLGERQWVVDLKEYAESPEVYQNVELPVSLRELRRARVIAPLLQLGGLAGFVVLLEPPPPFDLTFEDRDLLKTVGRHVATILAQHEADRRLAESRQFDAYHRLTAFMMHDLKNSVAQLQLVVRNAEKHRHNPAFIDDALDTIANAVERMNRLIEQLRDSGRPPPNVQVDLVPLLERVVARCADREPRPRLVAGQAGPVCVLADAERLAAALEHVVRNAQDATSPGGDVGVSLQASGPELRVSVHDSGAGMSPEFLRERLFRPFDSTKGAKGMGIGAYQVREYVRSLGGSVEVQSSPGAGTRFEIILPACDAAAKEGGR